MAKISDFTAITDEKGNILHIKGPGNSFIPPDNENKDYREFLKVDTGASLCTREVRAEPVPDNKPSFEKRITALEEAVFPK